MSLTADTNPGLPFVLQLPAFASIHLKVVGPVGQTLATATGFVVDGPDQLRYLITNRHVVAGRDWETDAILHEGGVAPSALQGAFQLADGGSGWKAVDIPLGDGEGQPLWREHPRYGRLVDVAAIPLGDIEEREGLSLVPYALRTDYARLDLTGELYVIGFPLNFDPVAAAGNLGIWMRGTIAWPPQVDWRNLPCMLLDCRTRKGQSGSPVVFWADNKTTYIGRHGVIETGPAWNLVGVYSGRIHEDADIGIVWRRLALEQIIDDGVVPAGILVSPLDEPSS